MAELCPECGVWPARPGGGVCVDCEADCGCDALVLDSGHCSECGAEIVPAAPEEEKSTNG